MKILLLIFMGISLAFGLDCSYIENTSNRDNEQLCRRTVAYETLLLGDKYEKEYKVKVLEADNTLRRKLLPIFFAEMEMCYKTCIDKLNNVKK